MNWYIKAQNQNMINLIAGWLRSARGQDLYVHDLMNNLDALDNSLMNLDEVHQAAHSASMAVAKEQGGYLTMHQQNLLNQLSNNIQPVPEDTVFDDMINYMV